MARSAAWVWLTLGTTMALAASCSSSDSKQTPTGVMPDIGGEPVGGASSGHAGGGVVDEGGASATPNSSGAANGGQGVGGEASGETTDGWLSGTRLRAVLDVAGEAKRFNVWHDTELDVDCLFGPDADGTERCLPQDLNGYAAYSDAKCTKVVAVLASDKPVPAWVAEPKAYTCQHGPSYVAVGATVAVTDLYTKSGADCVANGTVSATQIVKATGAAVPASTFVATSKIVRETRDARLSAKVRVAADGAREVVSLFDLDRKADCAPREHAGDDRACVPIDRAYLEGFFANAACDVPAAYRPDYTSQVCGKAPDIVQESREWFTDNYFEVGKDVTGATFSKQGTCKPYDSTFEAGATFFAVGKAIAWSSLAQLSSKNEGAGRIQLVVTRGTDDELLTREAFFDTTFDVVCQPTIATDLKPRCAPYAPFQVGDFADDTCKQGLFETAAGSTPIVQAAFAEANAPGGGATIFKRGAKVAVPTKVWQLSGADCVETTPSAGLDFYATTTITPAEMALMTQETE